MADDILIIGAGPAGLACAMELSRAGKKSLVIEKDEKVGGLAKTLTFKEGKHTFLTDIGPHRFFSKNPYLYDFIEDLLHEKWRQVPRQTRQFIDGKFYDYPINAGQAFKNIGLFKSMRIGIDYMYATMLYKGFNKKIVSFEDYIVSNFGKTLANFNMINYTEKIWGIPASTIHPDWARQRIKGLNLVSALKNALFHKKGATAPKSLVDQFYYPQFGTGLIYDTIAQRLKKTGSTIHTKSHPTKIHHDGKKITAVDLVVNGKKKTVKPKHLVESIPITELFKLMHPAPPQKVIDAAAGLKWRAQVYLFLTLDKESITKDNWVYFPNKEIPFGRVAEMKNFSEDMCPKGKTSLFVEYFVFEGDELWNMNAKELYEHSLPFFEKIGFFTGDEVRNYYLLKRKHVYPVYDMEYQDHLKVIMDYLDAFDNLHYIGRPGRFKYTNQDHSLEMGIMACRRILDGKKYDLQKIGAETEYFEKGLLHQGKKDTKKQKKRKK